MKKCINSKRVIYLPYEIYNREVAGHLHFAEQLISDGHVDRVYIGSKLLLAKLAKFGFLPLGVWFLKSAQKYSLPFIKKLKNKGFRLILQDAEAISTFDGFADNNPHDVDLFMKPKICRQYCDAIFATTKYEYDSLVNDGESKKLFLTGGLRFYHYLDNRFITDTIKHSKQKRLLIITSASSLRMHKNATISEMGHALEGEGINKSHIEFIMSWAEESHIDLFSIFSIITKLIKYYSANLEIVIRPHPSENTDVYRTLFSSFSEVKVDYESSLFKQLKNADVVLAGSASTTIIEAALVGHNPLTYFFMPKSMVSKSLVGHITETLANVSNHPDELFNEIVSIFDTNQEPLGINVQDAKDYLNLSTENFRKASKVIGELSIDIPDSKLFFVREFIFIFMYQVLVINLKWLTKIFKMKNINYAISKSKATDVTSIKNICKKLNVEVNNINDDLFVIRGTKKYVENT